VQGGQHFKTDEEAKTAAMEALQQYVNGSALTVRHDCTCNTQLIAFAQPEGPYRWSCPRDITCDCGQTYLVKLSVVTHKTSPDIEFIPKPKDSP